MARNTTIDHTVGVIGAGAAGLVTAQVLIRDGFDVQIITRDRSVGGVWEKERVYPGLNINNVHGEFRFSSLSMPTPSKASKTGGRLSGEDMCIYMERFADTYLQGKIKYQTEVTKIYRSDSGVWLVETEDASDNAEEPVRNVLRFFKIVLCTGGCSSPKIPIGLSYSDAEMAQFQGLVLHSTQFRSQLDHILEIVKPAASYASADTGVVVIVGGGRKVKVVFVTTDAILAVPIPLPDFVRKSRFLGLLSPHIELRTRLERFLHGTWLGGKIVHFIWDKITQISFNACAIPKNSPLRKAHSLFWGIRSNDEGVYREDGFHGLVNTGQIELVAPARVETYAEDVASVVILATGYSSSWSTIFDDSTAIELGISRHPALMKVPDVWSYASLSKPPRSRPESEQNLIRRDFAINGAVFTTNNGYTFEVVAHWISSYFLKDAMRLPSSHRKKRFPDMLLWTNESYSSNLAFWTWPQVVDELLEDMYLPNMRSGGNWLTWPFKVIDLKEIANLGEERRLKRHGITSSTS
ncbi:hypothetical protein BDZ94DRAFT_1281005 [Collybia nuda]|uniref:Flavin-containing monooxygenase n=1 Tax=Collybia nuda TaxID=64659 RepID=A0A9P5YEV4_9AGAR|nr:hypothetical protein BDZ94DRAFT_1281005 [Collybia nuda]